MSNPYESAKGGRLTFKGGALASRSKAIDKKKKKKNHKKETDEEPKLTVEEAAVAAESGSAEPTFTIDAAKRMKYEDLFPVEAKKFGYDPKNTKAPSVEQALDDRVKKKADRYCK